MMKTCKISNYFDAMHSGLHVVVYNVKNNTYLLNSIMGYPFLFVVVGLST